MITIWITTYALSTGIFEKTVEDWKIRKSDNPNAKDTLYLKDGYTRYEVGKNCFLEKQLALDCAEQMRVKKIASLQKQLRKLETKPIRIVESKTK